MRTMKWSALLLLFWIAPTSLAEVKAQCASGYVTLLGFTSTGGQGTYSDPATGMIEINFCFTLTEFFESNTNWVHGVFVATDNLPAGAIVCEGATGSQNAQHGSRKWIFVDSSKAVQFGLSGPGFYVDEGDGNPTNNYGDNGIGTPIATFGDLEPFCFKVKINCGSTPPVAYVPKVTVTGDGTSGGWTNVACMGDVFRATEGGPNGNGAVVVCGIVLPVKLLGIKAENTQDGNLVRWTASSDKLFSHFELEKSQSGFSSFQFLSRIEVQRGSTGNSNEIFDYQFLDNAVGAFNAYRLKMLEKDGTFKYSPVVIVQTKLPNLSNSKFSIYPNPARDLVYIQNESGNRYTSLRINVLDVCGKLVQSNLFTGLQSRQQYYLDLSEIHSGLYLLEIFEGDIRIESLNFLKL